MTGLDYAVGHTAVGSLAVSVGVQTPAFPRPALQTVLGLLCGWAESRHGAVALLRALSRAERAPLTIAAL